MTIKDLMEQSHATALDKGWWDRPCICLNLAQDAKPLSNCELCHGTGSVRGGRNLAELIALAHSELSEALEESRSGKPLTEIYFESNGKPCGFTVELADLFIRILDTAAHYNLPLEDAIKIKMAYNKTRPYRHGKVF